MQHFIKCWRVRQPFDCGAIAEPVPTPSVEDRVLVILSDLTPVSKDFRVFLLRDRAQAVRGLQAIAAGFLAVDVGLDCI